MIKKILVAEDHQGISETYKLILEAQDYEVTMTANGEDCIKAFDTEVCQENNDVQDVPTTKSPFDLVVLDYHMPYKDGIDVASHILSIAPYQRILIASSYPKDVITKSAQNLHGCIELLLKPFDLQEFEDAVKHRSKLLTLGSQQRTMAHSDQCLVVETN